MCNRRTGRTTRLIDNAIQEFLENGFCLIRDHAHDISEIADKEMLYIIRRRLSIEHDITNLRTRIIKWDVICGYSKMEDFLFLVDKDHDLNNYSYKLALEERVNEFCKSGR